MFVFSTLCLHRNYEVLSMIVQANINFINFDLTYPFDGSSEVVLQRVRSNSQKSIYQSVVPDFRKESLLVI